MDIARPIFPFYCVNLLYLFTEFMIYRGSPDVNRSGRSGEAADRMVSNSAAGFYKFPAVGSEL
jgi:hypothetical protein